MTNTKTDTKLVVIQLTPEYKLVGTFMSAFAARLYVLKTIATGGHGFVCLESDAYDNVTRGPGEDATQF